MKRGNKVTIRAVRLIAGIALTASVGCITDEMADCGQLPAGAIPSPVGTYGCEWQQSHALAAEESDFVIYQAAWVGETDRLGSAARKRVAAAATRTPEIAMPWIVESSDAPELDEQRRLALTDFLAQHGCQVEPEGVVVAHAESLGLYGQEAGELSRSIFQQKSENEALGNVSPFSGARGSFRGGLGGGFDAL